MVRGAGAVIRHLMQRLFTQAQRNAIYLLSGGHCAMCGFRIWPGNWHADHIKPFSKGGLTVMANAQGFVPNAISSKERTWSTTRRLLPSGSEPRAWQRKFLSLFEAYANRVLQTPVSQREAFVLNAFPGSGKTMAQLAAMAWLYKEQKIDFIVVCVPSDMLRTQFAAEAQSFGLYLHDKCNLKVKPRTLALSLRTSN